MPSASSTSLSLFYYFVFFLMIMMMNMISSSESFQNKSIRLRRFRTHNIELNYVQKKKKKKVHIYLFSLWHPKNVSSEFTNQVSIWMLFNCIIHTVSFSRENFMTIKQKPSVSIFLFINEINQTKRLSDSIFIDLYLHEYIFRCWIQHKR